ncbi:MAG: hypothetical protein GEU82_16085 [Luteitalea sp.]|nr:hypothetical protein [Luteitalea sp.]
MTRLPRIVLLLSLAAAASVAAASVAATAQKPPAGKPAKGSGLITLIGCVSANPSQPGGFLLSESNQVSQYKLTGTSVRDFAGQRVQISGEPPRRLRIVGGLYPSPNVAAQGGHDPVKAAIAAATPSNTPGGTAMQELRVKSVRAVSGACPEQ